MTQRDEGKVGGGVDSSWRRKGVEGITRVKLKLKLKLKRRGIDRRATNRHEKYCSRINQISSTEKESFPPKR